MGLNNFIYVKFVNMSKRNFYPIRAEDMISLHFRSQMDKV
ncbi:hypothetical protein LCGC14_0570350 [marine sediment metagenome]|uniref:Uncharacterized protein n=1 Tax=marine sediment metagenome TaxID=412755 RepID=A0A0F9USL2_9ZZZZ